MLKTILKVCLVAIGLICIPIALAIGGTLLTVVGPLAGALMVIFLPLIIIGVIIGYLSAKKKKE